MPSDERQVMGRSYSSDLMQYYLCGLRSIKPVALFRRIHVILEPCSNLALLGGSQHAGAV